MVPSPPTLTFPDTMGSFRVFCQKVLPAVYDDSLSYYELLCKVVDYLNKTMSNVNDLNEDTRQLYEYLKQLQELFEQFMESGFEKYYEEQLNKWICVNMPCIIASTMTFFSFGIDDKGYVYCDIPSNWQFLSISWNMEYGSPNFGQIEMEW